MVNPVYEEAMNYALQVLRAVKESECEMDWPLEQFVNESLGIGAVVAKIEGSKDQDIIRNTYNDALGHVYRAMYWAELLSQVEDYKRIPFYDLRNKCDEVRAMLSSSVKLIDALTGKGGWR